MWPFKKPWNPVEFLAKESLYQLNQLESKPRTVLVYPVKNVYIIKVGDKSVYFEYDPEMSLEGLSAAIQQATKPLADAADIRQPDTTGLKDHAVFRIGE